MRKLVHYSVDKSKGQTGELADELSSVWVWKKVEAETEAEAIEKIHEIEGSENINYILSVNSSS